MSFFPLKHLGFVSANTAEKRVQHLAQNIWFSRAKTRLEKSAFRIIGCAMTQFDSRWSPPGITRCRG